MDKITNQPEAKNRKGSTEIKIEDKISNMLYEVMEEKDSNESFEWDCGEIDDEFKLSRPSTRRQTTQNPNDITDSNMNTSNMTQFLAFPSFNRANKRNMTQNLNPVYYPPHFNMNMKGPNLQIPRKSAQYSNFGYNSLNMLNPNFYPNNNNSFNNSNLFLFNNNNLNNNNINLNQSFQSFQSFNPQFNDSFISNNLGNNNIIANNYAYNANNNNYNPQYHCK